LECSVQDRTGDFIATIDSLSLFALIARIVEAYAAIIVGIFIIRSIAQR